MKSLNVIVADDEEIVRKVVVDYLQATGHSVRQAEDGIEALTAIESDQCDLVIADVRMPRMGGVALLTECRQKYPDLPVIVITGHGDEAGQVPFSVETVTGSGECVSPSSGAV